MCAVIFVFSFLFSKSILSDLRRSERTSKSISSAFSLIMSRKGEKTSGRAKSGKCGKSSGREKSGKSIGLVKTAAISKTKETAKNVPDVSTPNLITQEENMIEALVLDDVEPVKQLLDSGFKIEKFLTVERLEQLYNKNEKASTFMAAMDEVMPAARLRESRPTLPVVGLLLRYLMGTGYDASRYRKRKLACPPIMDLFIWAVLTERRRMALFLWRIGGEAIAKALVAIKLNKALSEEASDEPNADDACPPFDKSADEFSRLSYDLLAQCYQDDDDLTLQLLMMELPNWGNETCLSLAIRAHHQEFIAHGCCQLLLNDLWQGGLRQGTHMTPLVLVSLALPPALFLLDYKTKTELELQAQRGEEVKRRFDQTQSSRDRDRAAAKSGTRLTFVEKVHEFYAAPVTKFWSWTVSYLVFLAIYTWFVFLKTPTTFSAWNEFYILCYGIVRVFDLIREVLMSQPSRIRTKLRVTYRRKWNLAITAAVITLFSAPTLRAFGPALTIRVRLVYVCNVLLWYICFLDIMRTHAVMGPYIVMFGQTINRFLELSPIFATLVFSYGLVLQSIRHQNVKQWEWRFLREVPFLPFFMIFGEVFPDKIDECGVYNENCVDGYWVTPIAQALYMLIMNTLLLNLLVATFTNIFTSVNASSTTMWKYHRYGRVMEYEQKPLLPPPFTVISHIFMLIKYARSRLHRKGDRRAFDQALKLVLPDEQAQILLDFEAKAIQNMPEVKKTERVSTPPEFTMRAGDKIMAKVSDVAKKHRLCWDRIRALEGALGTLERHIRLKTGLATNSMRSVTRRSTIQQ